MWKLSSRQIAALALPPLPSISSVGSQFKSVYAKRKEQAAQGVTELTLFLAVWSDLLKQLGPLWKRARLESMSPEEYLSEGGQAGGRLVLTKLYQQVCIDSIDEKHGLESLARDLAAAVGEEDSKTASSKCRLPTCSRPVTAVHCNEHQCSSPDCVVARQAGMLCCVDHTCARGWCPKLKGALSKFCADHACGFPDCFESKKPTQMGFGMSQSLYCSKHSCEEAQCKEWVDPASKSKWCIAHKCSSCVLRVFDTTSGLCKRHHEGTCHKFNCAARDCKRHEYECALVGCEKARSSGVHLCRDHKCIAEDCLRARSAGQLCDEHTCDVSDCLDQTATGRYCSQHECQTATCGQYVRGVFCDSHRCCFPSCNHAAILDGDSLAVCSEHRGKCFVTACDHDSLGSRLCPTHTCQDKECSWISGAHAFCRDHRCPMPNCDNSQSCSKHPNTVCGQCGVPCHGGSCSLHGGPPPHVFSSGEDTECNICSSVSDWDDQLLSVQYHLHLGPFTWYKFGV